MRRLVRRPRPSGLAATLGIRVGGGQKESLDCLATATPTVSFGQGVTNGTTKIGLGVGICFTGFDVRRALTVTIARSGRTIKRTLNASYVERRDENARGGTALLSYQLWLANLPPTQPGRRVVTATQPGRSATGEFRLLKASVPALWIVPSADSDYALFWFPDIRVRDPIRIVTTGLRPGDRFQVHIYGGPVRGKDYYITTFTVRSDANGHALLRIATSQRDRGFQLCPVPAKTTLRRLGYTGAPAEYNWCRWHWFTVGGGPEDGRRPKS